MVAGLLAILALAAVAGVVAVVIVSAIGSERGDSPESPGPVEPTGAPTQTTAVAPTAAPSQEPEPVPPASVAPRDEAKPDAGTASAPPAAVMVFAPRSAMFEADTRHSMFKLARRMKEEPDLKLELVGHSDRTTDGNRADKLGETRAKNLHDFLVQLGIDADRIRFVAAPPTTTTNLNNDQAAHHRRVDAIWQ